MFSDALKLFKATLLVLNLFQFKYSSEQKYLHVQVIVLFDFMPVVCRLSKVTESRIVTIT